jgi:hypothetical protein
MHSPHPSVDDSALTEPVSRQAAIDYETKISDRFGFESARRDLADVVVRGIFLGIGVAGLGLGAVVYVVMAVLTFVNKSLEPVRIEPVFGYYLPVAALCVILVVVLRVRHWRRHDPTTRRYRLHLFARANDWTYTPVVRTLVRPGEMFETGTTRATHDVISWDQPRSVEIGDHEYSPSPFRREVVRRGYVGIRLDAALPHIVLDAVANNAAGEGSSLRFLVDPDQRLSLEGDFDRHFHLYCPEGYERDALYLFSPDIMARFIDHAADFDVEIADDWLMLSTRDRLGTLDQDRWRQLLELVAAIEIKLGQWGRWRDDQPVGASAASPGRSRTLLPTLRSTPTAARARNRPAVGKRGKRLTGRRFRWGPLVGFLVTMAVISGPYIVARVLFGP